MKTNIDNIDLEPLRAYFKENGTPRELAELLTDIRIAYLEVSLETDCPEPDIQNQSYGLGLFVKALKSLEP